MNEQLVILYVERVNLDIDVRWRQVEIQRMRCGWFQPMYSCHAGSAHFSSEYVRQTAADRNLMNVHAYNTDKRATRTKTG